ncbi:uncharacterized protein DI49_1045 [Saccharomyces eubayanus]|uniref:uncharacterized protein n=1 Tax=Saccharomyces eubayanus TaxID=1080349 RepID=UPI0006C24664|nr:hypothetical protein DI49_1045 [Saccharomyces eubayanus]KOH00341.1 hypothetical protein DI49_1045 [Saccharomyces eubayanus]
MHVPIIFQTLLIIPYIGKYYCSPIEDKESKSEEEIQHALDNNIDSLGLLLHSISVSSNLTTGDPELDALFQDDLIPELYSILEGL